MSTTFKIREVNLNRKIRGTEWIKVDIFFDGKYDRWLWMNKKHIELNKRDNGKDCFLNELQEFLNA